MGAILLDKTGGKVLLGRRGIEPFYGDWNVIGGFLQYNEDPSAGLRREVKEELGVTCDVQEFVAALSDTYGPQGPALLNIYFAISTHSEVLKAADDVTELRWFPLDALPENMAFDSDREALRILSAKQLRGSREKI